VIIVALAPAVALAIAAAIAAIVYALAFSSMGDEPIDGWSFEEYRGYGILIGKLPKARAGTAGRFAWLVFAPNRVAEVRQANLDGIPAKDPAWMDSAAALSAGNEAGQITAAASARAVVDELLGEGFVGPSEPGGDEPEGQVFEPPGPAATPCAGNADCPAGQICVGGFCKAKPIGGLEQPPGSPTVPGAGLDIAQPTPDQPQPGALPPAQAGQAQQLPNLATFKAGSATGNVVKYPAGYVWDVRGGNWAVSGVASTAKKAVRAGALALDSKADPSAWIEIHGVVELTIKQFENGKWGTNFAGNVTRKGALEDGLEGKGA
jgi:hypothetical protein